MLRFAATLACLFALTFTTTSRAQTGTVTCDLVQGDTAISSITNTDINGTLSGDVTGTITITVDHVYPIFTPFGWARYIKGHGTLSTADGAFDTHDHILIYHYHGQTYWTGVDRLTNGSGVYADHVGRLKSHGTVNADHTANLHYHGAICTASP
jgi:hypothetical protein